VEEKLQTCWAYVTGSPWLNYTDELVEQLDNRVQNEKEDFIQGWRYDHGDLEIGDDPLDRGNVKSVDDISELFCDECHHLNWVVGVKAEAHICSDCWNDLGLKDQGDVLTYAAEAEQSENSVYVLVGCGDQKQDELVPAEEMYSSDYFGKKKGFAEEFGDDWLIISALHEALPPREEIEPYDKSADDIEDIEAWLDGVDQGIQSRFQPEPGDEGWVLIGKSYLKLTDDNGRSLRNVLQNYSWDVKYPFEQTVGNGQQKQYLKQCVERSSLKMPYDIAGFGDGQTTFDSF